MGGRLTLSRDRLPDGAAIIYGLIDPRTHHLRYVGKTEYSLRKRLTQHVRRAKNAGVREWIEGLAADGLRPEICEIETVPSTGWMAAEVFWIAFFRCAGAELFNVSDGGGQSPPHSAETRKRLSDLAKERMKDPDFIEILRMHGKKQWDDPLYREKTVAAQHAALTEDLRRRRSEDKKKDWQDPVYRQSVRDAQAKVDRSAIALEFWQRPEYREARAESNARRRSRGPWISEEARKKMSAAKKGKPQRPEHAAKSAAARRGIVPSAETRAKISAAHKARHAARLAEQETA